MAEIIACKRCEQKRAALGYAPLPTELGQRIGREICQQCWSEWLAKQSQIINHYGLNLVDPDAQNFLLDNMNAFFFNEDRREMAQIDTTQEGKVKW